MPPRVLPVLALRAAPSLVLTVRAVRPQPTAPSPPRRVHHRGAHAMANQQQYPIHMQFAAQSASPYQQQQQLQQQQQQQQQHFAGQQQNAGMGMNMPMQYNGMGSPAPQQQQRMNGTYPGQQTQQAQPQQTMNGTINPAALQQLGMTPAQYQQQQQMAQMKMAMNRTPSSGPFPQQQQQQQGFDPNAQARALMQQQQQGMAAMAPPRPPTAQQSYGSPASLSNGFGAQMQQQQQQPQTPGGYGQQPQHQQQFMTPSPRPGTPHQQQPQQQLGQPQQQFVGQMPQRPSTPQISRPPTAGPMQMQPRPLSPSIPGMGMIAPDSPMMRGAKRKASELGAPGTPPPSGPHPQSQQPGLAQPMPMPADVKVADMAYNAMDSPMRPPTAAAQVPSTPNMMAPPAMAGMSSGVSPLGGPSSFGTPGPSQSPLAHRRPTAGPMNGLAGTPSRAGSSFMGLAGSSKPGLPGNANPDLTKITKVALAGSGTTIPPLSDEEMKNMKDWLEHDTEYGKELLSMKDRMRKELQSISQRPSAWFEKDPYEEQAERARGVRKPKEKLALTYPIEKNNHRDQKLRLWRKKRLLIPPRTLPPSHANIPEQLVPIRLEFDFDTHKFRETFVWNVSDPIVTVEMLAASICDDFSLNHNSYIPVIVKLVNEQINDFRAHIIAPHGDADIMQRGRMTEDDAEWWARWRKRLRTDSGTVRIGKKKQLAIDGAETSESAPRTPARRRGTTLPVDDLEEPEKPVQATQPEEDLRIAINIDILVGSMNLKDQFEWDIVNPYNSPEQFAEVYCTELGLGGEFRTAIAHCIREQTQIHLKSLFVVGHPMDGTPILEEDVRQAFLPAVDMASRSYEQTATYTPIIDYLSEGDIERAEKEREKELKRKRRQTKGKRGVALPDREPPRSHRTPAIGFPDVDPSISASAISAPTSSKRAAAAAASLTIASMVASENAPDGRDYGGPISLPLQQHTPHKPVQPAKPTRTRGLFKPPPIPNPIQNPRAAMTKTASTALTVDDHTMRPPDSSGSVVLTAFQRPKDEFVAEGQHKNIIEGVWHCSNCGAPDGVAVGRRKGPNGIKSQCGPCGKYWHQHRKPRPVHYSTDRAWHVQQLREASRAKKGKNGRHATASSFADRDVFSSPVHGGDNDGSYNPRDMAPSSPQSTMSSMSQQSVELPLSKKARVNGSSRPPAEGRGASPPPPPPAPIPVALPSPRVAAARAAVQPPPPIDVSVRPSTHALPTSATDSTPVLRSPPLSRPEWLTAAMQDLQSRYMTDRFEVVQRPRVQSENVADDEIWRIRCIDCPGKLYKPGPEQSLVNFEVHLRNRLHRAKVSQRLGLSPDAPPSSQPQAQPASQSASQDA
ncbi:SNF5-domain-containing protein [Exidia glandulosa HHB12029]|uniref:SNF5-domain-containing protein n=1 Tax=Exidia glandulosa HHB12029 TaxID=1314781 RepID=A0A165DM99_EXIGL|nr:SNF5-domain-containing protein [Exidia glandulosa HHB12029]